MTAARDSAAGSRVAVIDAFTSVGDAIVAVGATVPVVSTASLTAVATRSSSPEARPIT